MAITPEEGSERPELHTRQEIPAGENRRVIPAGPTFVPKQETLGSVAALLLPLEKLKLTTPRGRRFEQEIHDFLLANYNGYTVSSGNISGHWKDDQGRDHYGEHREYKVAVADRESTGQLELFIARLAAEMDEECVYLELGEAIYLVYRKA